MLNREYQIRATRQARAKLEGEQLDITFPRRGRPSRFRNLERAGQMRLTLCDPKPPRNVQIVQNAKCDVNPATDGTTDDFDDALQMTFPVRPMTEDELTAEFERLFPL